MFYIWLVSNGRLLLLPASVSHGTVGSYHKVECLIAVTYPKCGKLSREKTVAKFEVLWLYSQSSPQNLEAWCLLVRHKQTIHESSLCGNCILYQFAKVFFSKVSHYAVVILQHNLRPIAVLPAHR